MASTGEFDAGSQPSITFNCSATASRSGSTVTVNFSVWYRKNAGTLGSGYYIYVTCAGSRGGSKEIEIKNINTYNADFTSGTKTGSFTFTDSSNDFCSVTFSSRTNTSSTGKFSGKSFNVMYGGNLFITANSSSYIELFGQAPWSLPTWSNSNQSDIQWRGLGGSSWSRGGTTWYYGDGHTHATGLLDNAWHTHYYGSGDYKGAADYYPRIYVKYNANGGSSTPSTQTKYIGNQLTLASAISRTHYTFKGWGAASNSTSGYAAGAVINYMAWNSLYNSWSNNHGWNTSMPNSSGNTTTLYAIWSANQYKISYNANGGASTPTAQTVTYPGSTNLSAAIKRNNGTSTSTGTITISYNTNGGSTAPGNSTGTYTNTTTTTYAFEKWHLNSASGTAYAASASYQPTANVTMYAGWTSSSSTARTTNPSITLTNTKPTKSNTTVSSYKVTYNANGGSSTPSEQTATKTRSYTFSKWNSKSDGSGTDYNGNTAYTFSANATLYAKYTTSDSGGSITLPSAITRANGSTTGYKVTYNANGGSGAPSEQTSGNRTITYTFNKWAAGSASGTGYAAGASFTPSAATTMYATWTSSTSANSSWTSSSTTPTKTGYTFKGWAKSSTATTPDYEANKTYTITGALDLYAVWEINKYSFNICGSLDGTEQTTTAPMGTFKLTLNSGTKSAALNTYSNTSTDYGTTYSISDITTASGYTYDGIVQGAATGTINSNTKVVLGYSANEYTVSYNSNGGTSTPSEQTGKYNSSITLAKAITRDSYTGSKFVTVTYDTTESGQSAPAQQKETCYTTTPFTFNKWALNSTEGTAYNAEASYTIPAANSTMYATWNQGTTTVSVPAKITLSDGISRASSHKSGTKVSFNSNGGNITPAEITGDIETLYTFNKWEDSSGNKYDPNTEYEFSDNITLKDTYTSTVLDSVITLPSSITKNSTTDSSYSVTYSVPIECDAVPGQTATTTSSYTFKGWYEDQAATTLAGQPGDKYSGSATTLYAGWTRNTSGGQITLPDAITRPDRAYAGYEVLLFVNDGTEDYTTVYSSDRAGKYTFNYWNDGVNDYSAGSKYTPTKDTTMTTKWSIKIDKESTLIIPNEVPTRKGYMFIGWATEEGATAPEYYPGDTVTLTEGVWYYAVWSRSTPTISTKVDGQWYDGEVNVNVNGEWVLASEIYINDNGTWRQI